MSTTPAPPRNEFQKQRTRAKIARQHAILQDLKRGITSKDELAEKHGVSPFTVRKDLRRLEKKLIDDQPGFFKAGLTLQIERYLFVYRENMEAWQKSKVEAIKTETEVANTARGEYKRGKKTVQNKYGDTRYINAALKALERIDRILGHDHGDVVNVLQQNIEADTVSVQNVLAQVESLPGWNERCRQSLIDEYSRQFCLDGEQGTMGPGATPGNGSVGDSGPVCGSVRGEHASGADATSSWEDASVERVHPGVVPDEAPGPSCDHDLGDRSSSDDGEPDEPGGSDGMGSSVREREPLDEAGESTGVGD